MWRGALLPLAPPAPRRDVQHGAVELLRQYNIVYHNIL